MGDKVYLVTMWDYPVSPHGVEETWKPKVLWLSHGLDERGNTVIMNCEMMSVIRQEFTIKRDSRGQYIDA